VYLLALLSSGCQGGASQASTPAPVRDAVVAMARLEPLGRVVKVAAEEEGVVARVAVEEGAHVHAGDPIAYLESHRVREIERRAAKLKLERTGLEPLGLEAQRADLRILEAEAVYYESEVGRQRAIVESGLLPSRALDEAVLESRRAAERAARARTEMARAEGLARISREEAEVELARAEARLESAIVRSPIDGTVLKLLVRPGEKVALAPVARVGSTEQMAAMAEVHANDIGLVKVGQRATFTASALPQPIEGTVERVGEMIDRNDVLGEDPTAPANARVVTLTVKLDDSREAARYTNLEGQIRIRIAPAPGQ
jgi:HlyD family secretion protein